LDVEKGVVRSDSADRSRQCMREGSVGRAVGPGRETEVVVKESDAGLASGSGRLRERQGEVTTLRMRLNAIAEVEMMVNDSESESSDDGSMTKEVLVPSPASDVLQDQSRVGWCK